MRKDTNRFASASVALAGLAGLLLLVHPGDAEAARCLFVSSYHKGYEWSDGVERGLRSVLDGRCEVRQFDMDTKRHKDETSKRRAAEEARALVESWEPDVVITADDNAAKYLIAPYYRDADVPFVFCGVNWTATEYGFPYSNVTGMVEVAPVRPMLEKAVRMTGGTRAVYIGADTHTEHKNSGRFLEAADALGITIVPVHVSSTGGWLDAYRNAQGYDFVVLGSNAGINDWDKDRISEEIRRTSTKLSVTSHGWMMPYAMLGMTKVPEEQGEWSAMTALAILDGTPPADIPIIANRKWDVWANETLLAAAEVKLPRHLRHKAKRVQ